MSWHSFLPDTLCPSLWTQSWQNATMFSAVRRVVRKEKAGEIPYGIVSRPLQFEYSYFLTSRFIVWKVPFTYFNSSSLVNRVKGTAVHVQAWTGPEGSGTLISIQSAHEGGKIVSHTHRPPLPPPPPPPGKIFLVLICVRGWVDPAVIVRPEGLC